MQGGGAVNLTTINSGGLQVYGAANDPTIKGWRGDAAFTLCNAGSVVDISTYEYTLLDNGNH
ncbi:pertactin-like passenger domain-containing protein, partial [Escherichia coli]|uniref:pertactin-like passenger domain-containing protein n=1 Tax=Escherichia coli TaxID=562 RepID=UPI001BB0C583